MGLIFISLVTEEAEHLSPPSRPLYLSGVTCLSSLQSIFPNCSYPLPFSGLPSILLTVSFDEKFLIRSNLSVFHFIGFRAFCAYLKKNQLIP